MRTRLHLATAAIAGIFTLGFDVSAQSGPTVTATPTSVSFTYQVGAALPASQTVALRITSGTPAYTVTITGTNTLWLTATPTTGKLPGSLTVRANPTALTAGTYTATVSIAVSGITTPVTIPVTLVATAPLPTLTISTNAVSFSTPPSPPPTQSVKLATSGSPLSYSVTVASAPWLSAVPASGVLLPGAQTSLTFAVDATSLVPQPTPYTARVTVSAPGATAASKQQTITVTVTANAMTPAIASVWPPSIPLNSPDTTVTVRGANFYNASVAKVVGATAPLKTTVLGADVVLAVIPAALLNTTGTLKLYVSNPQPGGDSPNINVPVGNTATIQSVINGASMLAGPVSPGEMITILGDNLGPSTPAVMADANSDGYVDASLGGVSVTVDGIPAPIVYASASQINLQVPYGVTIGSNKVVSLTNGAAAPVTTDVTIALTAPGIFTLDGTGAGQAAAINSNGTLNSSQNSAKIGDAITLFVTGEGDYATSITTRDGYLIPSTLTPLPAPSPLPVVTIGGTAATNVSAVPVPGWILGLLMVTATVPVGSSTGAAVPVVVTVGGVDSQPNVTLCIKP
jgi:uncharacterized protein (TIGR03437 family)